MSGILPIKHWHLGDMLVDPTGASYDPNVPPALISGDETLDSAIEFGQEHASRIGVTVLCGLQTEAADLGEPGEFESHMFNADLYGGNAFAVAQEPGTEEYAARVEDAMINYARPQLLPFNATTYPNATTRNNFAAMGAAVDKGVREFKAAQSTYLRSLGTEPAPEEIGLDAFVGEAHLANHFNWLTVANTCLQVKRAQNLGDVQVLIDSGTVGYGIARIFGALGIQAELQTMQYDAWPPGMVSEVLDFESALTTGYVTY